MNESIQHEDERYDCQVKYIYFPIRDESISISKLMMSEERRAEMKRISAQLRKYLEELLTEEQYQWLDRLSLMRRGLTPWQIMQQRTPIELRMAYDACGRLKRNGLRK